MDTKTVTIKNISFIPLFDTQRCQAFLGAADSSARNSSRTAHLGMWSMGKEKEQVKEKENNIELIITNKSYSYQYMAIITYQTQLITTCHFCLPEFVCHNVGKKRIRAHTCKPISTIWGGVQTSKKIETVLITFFLGSPHVQNRQSPFDFFHIWDCLKKWNPSRDLSYPLVI